MFKYYTSICTKYTQKAACKQTLYIIYLFCFRPGGILVCKLEGASFWEKTPGADYLPHNLALPEGTEGKITTGFTCICVFCYVIVLS